MKILITRPGPASRRTADLLEAAGREVLIDPLLELDFCPPDTLVGDALPDAVILTSANAVRAVLDHPDLARLVGLPLWTVGVRTTEAAMKLGFGPPRGEAPDAERLAGLLGDEPPQTFLHLAAQIRAADLPALLPQHRIDTRVVYKAYPAEALSAETLAALAAGDISDVLHYSGRLAQAYVDLAKAAGILRDALQPRQICLSETVAKPLRAVGARAVAVAARPNEARLLALV